MNSLLSEFFKKFGGAYLEVLETIQGNIGGVCLECFGGFLEGLRGNNYYCLIYIIPASTPNREGP